jgi:putative hydrolase of the HAD superfamily
MIFFDIDGTLMDHAHAESAGALAFREEIPVFADADPMEFVALWHRLAEKHMNRFLAGETDLQGQRRDRMRELYGSVDAGIDSRGAEAAFERYLAYYRASWRLYPDALPCLDALAGESLGVISNGGSDQQRRKLAILGIGDRFDTVLISGDLGRAKPDPAIFLRACELAGLELADCVYVGDRLDTDARAATRAGMRGVYLDRKDLNREGDGAIDVPRIESLAELHSLLTASGSH